MAEKTDKDSGGASETGVAADQSIGLTDGDKTNFCEYMTDQDNNTTKRAGEFEFDLSSLRFDSGNWIEVDEVVKTDHFSEYWTIIKRYPSGAWESLRLDRKPLVDGKYVKSFEAQ